MSKEAYDAYPLATPVTPEDYAKHCTLTPAPLLLMRLLHHSAEPLGTLTSRDQDRKHFKPHGFWVSVEGPDDWRSWCEMEQWNLDAFKYTTEVVLFSNAKILHLSTAEELEAFTEKYGDPGKHDVGRIATMYINWEAVAAEYQGIVIAPYVHECRLSLMWYYTWDCASGCIWDVSAIKRLVPVENRVALRHSNG